jgi:hypothetical protein
MVRASSEEPPRACRPALEGRCRRTFPAALSFATGLAPIRPRRRPRAALAGVTGEGATAGRVRTLATVSARRGQPRRFVNPERYPVANRGR